jgi:hypothetical protein
MCGPRHGAKAVGNDWTVLNDTGFQGAYAYSTAAVSGIVASANARGSDSDPRCAATSGTERQTDSATLIAKQQEDKA